MISDGRAAAWLHCWNRLRALDNMKPRDRTIMLAESPDMYWSALSEAAIYAELAKAPAEVGLVAGNWIEEEKDRQTEDKKYAEDMLMKFKNKDPYDVGDK